MKKKKVFLIFTSISFLILLCIFLMRGYNHDFAFHLGRIEYIAEEFSQKGISALPIRIYSAQNNGYGYGTPLFYGEIFLYPFALMVLCGCDLLLSTMFAYFCFYVLNFIIPYFCCKKYFDENKSATFALLYAMSPYLIINTLQRGALGEVISSAFVPLVLLIFFKMLEEKGGDMKQILWLSLALTFILNAHTITALILTVTMALGFIFVCYKKKNLKYFKNKFVSFSLSALFFFLMNISFILPLLEQMISYEFRAFSGSGYIVYEHTVHILRMITNLPDLLNGVLTASEVLIPKCIFYFPAFAISVLLFYYCFKNKEYFTKYKILIKILIVLNILICWNGIWYLLEPLFGFIQFPWRLSTFVYMIISIILTDMLFNPKQTKVLTETSICVLSLFFILYLGFFYSYSIQICSNLEWNSHNTMEKMVLQDYISVNTNDLTEETLRNEVYGYNGEYYVNKNNGVTKIEFVDYDYSKGNMLELPVIPYKGYKVLINGTIPLEYKVGEHSQMFVKLENNYEVNDITIQYKGTITQKISFVISIISWLLIIVRMLYPNFKEFKNNRFRNKKDANYH